MQPKGSDPSRRGFLGELAMGLFAGKGPAGIARDGDASSASGLAVSHRGSFPHEEWRGFAGPTQAQPSSGECSYRGTGRLKGRRALITGGERGVGRAAAIAFAREGADVAFNYAPMARPEADQVAALIREAGSKAVARPGELRNEEFCYQLVDDAARELGGLDVLVSNAPGQYAMADIADMSTDQFDATFKTNIYAMFWLTKAALPHMGPGSSIINTSSSGDHNPSEILLDYAATKGAIMVFTKSLARQLASRGIRVNAVAPGPIWTPLRSSDEPPIEDQPQSGGDTRLVVPGQRSELVSIYVLLASNESSYSTGQLYGAVG